jgi:hypothetical protein
VASRLREPTSSDSIRFPLVPCGSIWPYRDSEEFPRSELKTRGTEGATETFY